jgi:hypothetical protein
LDYKLTRKGEGGGPRFSGRGLGVLESSPEGLSSGEGASWVAEASLAGED